MKPEKPATDVCQADAGRADAGRADAERAAPLQLNPGRADAGRADAGRTDPGRTDTGRADAGAGIALPGLRWLRKIDIRTRLLYSFFLLPLLPLLVSGYISYAESSKAIQEKTRVFATEIVKQVAKNVQLRMAQIEADSEALVLSDRVQSALARYQGDGATKQGRAHADMADILLGAYGSFDYINQKYFLDRERRVMDSQVFPELARGVIRFAAGAPTTNGAPYWSTVEFWSGQKSIVMLRQIRFKANNEPAGSLFLGIRQSHFSSIFDDVDLGKGSDVFIVDAGDGGIVARGRADATPQGANPASGALLEAIAASTKRGLATGFVSYTDGETSPYLAAFTRIPATGWYVVSAIPADKLLAEARSARDQIILIGMLCFGLAAVLAYVIWRSISAPLDKLLVSMREAERGNYAGRATTEGNDELTVLSHKFNEMAGTIGHNHELMEARVAERTRELEEANRKLAALSLTDSLTGIANRRRFDEALAVELQRAARAGRPLALMMIDVDFFKSYNDRYGHPEGDACLRKVARLLQTHARRASDLAARYGGEEFVMLAADTDADCALALAEAIRASLVELNLPHQQSPSGCVSVSIGVAVLLPDEEQSPEMFIRMADKAMYRAKEQGRNQVALAGRK